MDTGTYSFRYSYKLEVQSAMTINYTDTAVYMHVVIIFGVMVGCTSTYNFNLPEPLMS